MKKRWQKITSSETWYVGENRHIFFERNFQSLSQKAVDILTGTLRKILQRKKIALIVPSSGKSPKKLYEMLVQTYRDKIDWSRVIVMQMDEYWNMPCDDSMSMSFNIEREIILPLGIKKYIHFFDTHGRLIQTLDEYETLVEKLGGIDVVIHGIGRNGHIGFNEPGSDWSSPIRKVTLEDSTLEANFSTGDPGTLAKYRFGVTLGLDVLTKARHAILLITGSSKNAAVEKLFFEKPSGAIPASSLYLNPKVDCIIDSESILL